MKLLKLAGITITITIVATLLIKADQILSRDGVEQTKRDPVVFEADKDQKTETDNNESLPRYSFDISSNSFSEITSSSLSLKDAKTLSKFNSAI